jgi:hypothetical protein
VRLRNWQVTVAALPLALVGGCGALGLSGSGSGGSGGSASVAPSATPWFWYKNGSPTPSPQISHSGSPAAALPPVSFMAADPACDSGTFTRIDEVLIPLKVVPGKGSLTVSWPRQYDSGYRVTAVKQEPLVTGTQPPYTWQNVPAPAGCLGTATISGLASGVPYIVWLDAPNTGYERDGTRHLYSGRSGVVYPL